VYVVHIFALAVFALFCMHVQVYGVRPKLARLLKM
jgi:hypothetical protein